MITDVKIMIPFLFKRWLSDALENMNVPTGDKVSKIAFRWSVSVLRYMAYAAFEKSGWSALKCLAASGADIVVLLSVDDTDLMVFFLQY